VTFTLMAKSCHYLTRSGPASRRDPVYRDAPLTILTATTRVDFSLLYSLEQKFFSEVSGQFYADMELHLT
jgi:hypothetical protein